MSLPSSVSECFLGEQFRTARRSQWTAVFVLTVAVLLHLTNDCQAFNLEPQLPIVKKGLPGSHFGYAVAEHLIVDKRLPIESVLLVGAPRAQSSQPGTNHSGVVYRCKLSTSDDDCVPIRIDRDDQVPPRDVSLDDQWFGVTVQSQGPGGYVMACAHRYVLKGERQQWGQGICYSLTQFLDFQRVWEPCKNRPVNKAHEEFGYCQAGTSGHISEDHDIVIGTPGPYTWRGTIFKNNVRFGIRDDRNWYMGPLIDHASPVDKYSYLGMSVTSGKFFTNKTSFVGGAPRSNGVGEVVFYTRPDSKDTTFIVELSLLGEQFAASFGYSLTSFDCDGDDKLDLVVGAPFYYTKTEGGAVYVYRNTPEGLLNRSYALKLTGKPESRFGFALTSLGDINKDGYNDLAVGAPYEEEGGAVYVYLGSVNGIKADPAQIITAEDLPASVNVQRTFGYSLSGSHDLDQNGYPDLLVGAYDSDTVLLLRGRPIIDIVTSVKGNELVNIDPTKGGCEDDKNSAAVCFSFDACFQLNSTINQGLVKLKYRIEAETFTGKKYFRVKFHSSRELDQPNIVEKDIVLKGDSALQRREICSRELVYLKDKTDIQNAIKFKLTYKLVQKPPQMPAPGSPVPDINYYPILNQEEAQRIFEASFLKDCGSNDICESDLVLSSELHLPREGPSDSGDYVLYLGEEHVNLTLKIANRNEPAYDANIYIEHSASLSYVGRKMFKGEQIECVPRNKTVLRCELGNPFKRGETQLQLRFNPKAILDDEQSITFNIEANTTSADISPQRNFVNLVAKVVRVAELELRGSTEPDQVFYGGEVKGESAMVYEEDVGSVVVHTYVVTNRGPWKARRLEIVIDWPYEVQNNRDNGKWLLYLMETQVQGNGYCETSKEQLNPLGLRKKMSEYSTSESAPYVKRSKREVVVLPEEVREDGKTQQIVTMDCLRRTAKCFKFSCYLVNLKAEQTAVIKLRARLWNSTFVEDYASGVNQVHINSHAKIKIDSALDIKQQRLDNDYAIAKTKAYPDLPLLPGQEAPLWIIIVAVLLGILLLIVLIAILWKLGFFERKKYGYVATDTDDKDFNGY
ncbi:Integrin alpha-PS1 [Halotydeus destructor]|nr:Integrin alpha-PS1 [Halotydeus destructor]